jgi:uncharacterized protein YqjF (DUF2071 family)
MNPAACPYEVQRPVMIHHWNTLTFLHWRFEPSDVQRLLPPGLEVELRDGAAWVGLVPFFMRVGLPGAGSVPWVSRFCETNVRTYVRDASGRSGIWFFSLDAARLGAVIMARATYRLPYFWSRMELRANGSTVRYDCSRRWPGPRGAASQVVVTIGERYKADELAELDHFLTARWVLFSVAGGRQRYAKAQHLPWPLYRAETVECRDELVQAAGLPLNADPPVVHYSPGVQVRIGQPERDRLSSYR